MKCGDRTRCPRGHAYDGDNLILQNRTRGGGKPWRKCRLCMRRHREVYNKALAKGYL